MGKKKEIDVRFAKFGTVSFTATTRVNDFVSHLEDGRVTGTRCVDCGTKYFPPRSDCFKCLSSNVEWFDVTGTGKLVTYSRLKYAPVGFENDLPYCIALADYGDFKVFGRLADDLEDSDIQVGMAIKTRVNRLENGQLNYVFEKAASD